jgi:hypothetical protein
VTDSDVFNAGICLGLLQFSTSTSQIDAGSNANVNGFLKLISQQRTAMWLWTGAPFQFMTVIFHAADGPPKGKDNGRFCVCAATSGSIATSDAVQLWKDAVNHFASINGTSTDNIYLWFATDSPPSQFDPIVASGILAGITAFTVDGGCPTYLGTRWPPQISFRQFKNPLA